MSNLKNRIRALEQAKIAGNPFFYIDVVDYPTPEQWAEMQSAHDAGCVVFAWKADGNVCIWLPFEPVMEWS